MYPVRGKALHLPKATVVLIMTFVVLTITKHETRVWATGTARGAIPTKIFAPPDYNSHHFRDNPKQEGRGDGPGVPTYYREIIQVIKDATEILIIGHGHGKASSMLHFIQYLERKEPELATKVVDAIDTNLIAMTEPQILALARKWFETHPQNLASTTVS
jgi:hypothetical protein